ncbi:hypothetical protein F4803DRAFT_547400 [Xylaria telfairii]|nr:hypothetical protein F4803DRAFT_547400 [Xylaria telfairii]
MTSLTEFPLFARLPAELRFMVWEMSILEYHHDRIVPIDDYTTRVVCIRNLACSPHFSATWESRQIATRLYPIQLPVSKMIDKESGRWGAVIQHDNYTPRGTIYISPKHDIFALGMDVLLANGELHFPLRRPVGGQKNFAWRSATLTPSQCQSVRRMMVFNVLKSSGLKDGCRRTPYCAIRCKATIYDCPLDFHKSFSGVQTYIHAMLKRHLMRRRQMWSHIIKMDGPSVLDVLNRGGMLSEFDGDEYRKHEEECSQKCVCAMRPGEIRHDEYLGPDSRRDSDLDEDSEPEPEPEPEPESEPEEEDRWAWVDKLDVHDPYFPMHPDLIVYM